MINVSSWSIRNPIPAVMVFVMLTFAGLLSFKAMKVQNFPDIDLPTVTVSAALPGAAPAQLENDVARKLENTVASLQGLKHIYTKVQDGVVTVTAEFRLEKPVQEAVDDVRSAVQRIRADLPSDLRDPIVQKMDLAGQPVLAYTVRSPRMDDEALSWFVDNEVARRLLAVKGVGAVNRVGGVNREIRVALDPQRLQALGVTAAEVSRQLRQVQQEAAGGRTDLGGSEQAVRTLGTVGTAEEIADSNWPFPAQVPRDRGAGSGWIRWRPSVIRWPKPALPPIWMADRSLALKSRAAAARAKSRWGRRSGRRSKSSRPVIRTSN
jgi:multidrug efflux pump subunit AcrB